MAVCRTSWTALDGTVILEISDPDLPGREVTIDTEYHSIGGRKQRQFVVHCQGPTDELHYTNNKQQAIRWAEKYVQKGAI